MSRWSIPATGWVEKTPPWETIFVVDDDPVVLALARDILAAEGYQVLEAPGGEDALRIAADYAGPIHLLLTDVVMPGMNGRELADRLRQTRLETKMLFMSAFITEVVADYGVISGDPLITKPFTPAGLAHKVREILGYRSPFARPGGEAGRRLPRPRRASEPEKRPGLGASPSGSARRSRRRGAGRRG